MMISPTTRTLVLDYNYYYKSRDGAWAPIQTLAENLSSTKNRTSATSRSMSPKASSLKPCEDTSLQVQYLTDEHEKRNFLY